MNWLNDLRAFAEVGRQRYESRLAAIKNLPRGQYLREKQKLVNEPEVVLYRSTHPPVFSNADEAGAMPDELKALLAWSNGLLNLRATAQILEVQVYGVESIRDFRAMGQDLVDRDELFPPVFKRLLIFGSDLGRRHLAVWSDVEIPQSPVLLIDPEERELLIVSHSLQLFFQRMAFAIAKNIPFRIGSRSKPLREFVAEHEAGPVYPPKVRGETVFSWDAVNEFPDAWQAMLVEKDRSFQLD